MSRPKLAEEDTDTANGLELFAVQNGFQSVGSFILQAKQLPVSHGLQAKRPPTNYGLRALLDVGIVVPPPLPSVEFVQFVGMCFPSDFAALGFDPAVPKLAAQLRGHPEITRNAMRKVMLAPPTRPQRFFSCKSGRCQEKIASVTDLAECGVCAACGLSVICARCVKTRPHMLRVPCRYCLRLAAVVQLPDRMIGFAEKRLQTVKRKYNARMSDGDLAYVILSVQAPRIATAIVQSLADRKYP